MAKKQKNDKLDNRVWKNIHEADFYNENEIIEEDVGPFDRAAMILFSQNVNLFRHLPRLSDSLKSVERRILYSLFTGGTTPDKKAKKSNRAVGDTMALHAHGDASIYKTIVGLAQPWKNPVPMIQGIGNFGSDVLTDKFAHMRYTEVRMSKYSYECFFKDFDKDCIETIFNTSIDGEEPLSLPSRYPNILINSGFGIAVGNSFCIPTYNINDIISLCKRLIDNPQHPNIYMVPDSPTGCDIVDNGTLRDICDTGKGVMRMRSTIDIDGSRPNVWILKVKNIPWMTSIKSIEEKITKLSRDGILPIKDIQDHSYPIIEIVDGVKRNRKAIDFWIVVNRAHDPNVIKQKLFKMAGFEKSLPVNFKVVEDALSVGKLNMRDLVLSWLDARREYKRRLMNKKVVKISARISLLEVLLRLTEKDNIKKTISVVRNANGHELVSALMKHDDMSSFQAKQIADMGFRAYVKDAHDNYQAEMDKLKKEFKALLDNIKLPKKIDEEIKEELDGLLRYAQPRRSRIVSMDENKIVSDTEHFITITKQGMVKKLPYNDIQVKKTPALGAFKANDYPVHGFPINNRESVMLFDSFGKYSVVPLQEIENTEPSQYGNRVYDYAKLDGEIVSAFEYFSNDTNDFVKTKMNKTAYLVTLTKGGYLKKTPIDDFISTRSSKNVKAMKVRDDDMLIYASIIFEDVSLLAYTEQGQYAYISAQDIALQSKDSMGLLSIKLGIDDNCVGMCIIGAKDEYLIVVTEKGNVKKCELGYLGEPGKRKMSSYLATLDVNDKVNYVNSAHDKDVMTVCTRTAYQQVNIADIPVKARKSKCQKMVAVPLGNNIISISIK